VQAAPPGIYGLQSRADVAAMLGVPLRILTWVLHGPKRSTYYAIWKISKRNGRGMREIRAPRSTLYRVQRRLHEILQAEYQPREPTHGFVIGRNVVSNASPHVGRNLVLNVDLADFFPSINFGRVRGLFLSSPFNCPPEVATLLAQICCWEGRLPIGAPTSPVVSNMICLRMDREFQALARKRGCWYTRYADDLTFSTDRAVFSPGIAVASEEEDKKIVVLGAELRAILEGNGFEPNFEKIRLRSRHERQSVTGIIVNERLNIDRRDIRRVRAMLHSWAKFGLSGAQSNFVESDKKERHPGASPSFSNVLWGHISYLAQVRGSGDPFVQLFTQQFKNLTQERDINHGIDREAFPRPSAVPARPEERLVTIMFTDIVKSTPTAHAEGDKAWGALLNKHNRLTVQVLSQYGGYPVNRTGDGFVATFYSPRAAVSCGLAIAAAIKKLGIDVRIGLHTATVTLSRDDINGLGVHFAQRICGMGNAGEVLVSQAIRDIELGSSLEFIDFGRRRLKGFDGKWQLYKAVARDESGQMEES